MSADNGRVALLYRKLASRTGADGKPAPGFEKNCEAIRKEIARLEGSNL